METNLTAEPRFDLDLKYGQQAERLVGEYLGWLVTGNGRVEVKRKRIIDLMFYVEQECDKGRTGTYEPSGIITTGSDLWAFVIADTGIAICIPTKVLRVAMLDPGARSVQETDGNCPTKGVLVSIGAMFKAGARRKP